MRQTLTRLNLRSKLFALTLLAAVFLPSIVSAQVQVSITGTNVTCFGLCNGSATALGTGGWAPYTYHWSNGQNTATISGLCAGTYSVTVTDIDLGTAVGSITITQPTQLGVTVGGQSQICGNTPDGWAAAVPFGGTPPYTYLWNNGGTTPQINNLVAGVYTVTVTDAKSCTTAGSFTVGFWDEGVWLMTSQTNVTCFGYNNGTAHVSVMSGTPPYTYDWSNNGPQNPDTDIADIVGLAPGTYTVTVTDANGCSNQTSVAITQPTQLICAATSTPANCGLAGSATISATGGTAPYTYLWSNTQTGPTVTVMAGTYTATVTDLNGCTCSSTIVVGNNNNALTVNVAVLTSAGCTIGGSAKATVLGGSGNYSYLWDSNPPQTTQTATNLSAGPHKVTVTDIATGCQGIGNVVIPSSTTLTVVAAVGTNATCLVGGSATATPAGGLPPYTYDWSNNGAQNPDTDFATVLNLLAGPYTVTVTDAGGCTATASVTIIQTQGPTVTVSIVTNATCVTGGSAMANATGGTIPYAYLWSASANNQTTKTATNLSVGVHSVTVTDANGCAASGSVTITQPGAPTAIITGSTPSGCSSNSGSATAGATGGTGVYTYDWSNDGAENPDNDLATVSGLGAGTYTVTITDAAGCTSTASVSIAASFPPTVVITASTNANCSTPGSATASVSGGTGPFIYHWDNNESTATAVNLSAGAHSVTVTDAAGCVAIASVTIGSTNNGIKIGDFVWYDNSQEGFQNPGETNGVNNITVMLIKAGNDGIFGTADDVTVQTKVTTANGLYFFDCVTPGTYILMFSGIPAGYQWTTKDYSTNDCLDSDVKQNGKTDPFTIIAGQTNNLCFDAGIHTICDNVIGGGSICCNQTICEGQTPALIANSLLPFGGSGALQYMWMQFIAIGGAPPQWVSIPGAMSASYQPGPLFETTRFIRCARRDGCDHWVESNFVEITVLPAGSPGCSGFISDFSVVQHGPGSVEVRWTTLPEATEYMYTVQHSTNLVQWTNVTSVIGKQDPLQPNAYSFMHETPANGKNFYRIKRATASGQIAYSEQREIAVLFDSDESVRITPNPVVDKLKIMNVVEFDADVTVTISSTKGDILQTVTLKKGKLEEIELTVTDLPTGIYLARIRFADGSIKTLKITKI
jgi:hypothetical protein